MMGAKKELKTPNQHFFKLNGTMEESTSLTAESQFLLVRHGQSVANIAHEALAEYYSYKPESATKKVEQKAERDLLQKSASFIDSDLTEVGLKEAADQQVLVNQFDLHQVVLVSPHKRTIRTACGLLATHPQKDQLVLRLTPMLKEATRSSQSCVCGPEELKEFCDKVTLETGIKIENGDEMLEKADWTMDVW
jgi:hypothetical protein